MKFIYDEVSYTLYNLYSIRLAISGQYYGSLWMWKRPSIRSINHFYYETGLWKITFRLEIAWNEDDYSMIHRLIAITLSLASSTTWFYHILLATDLCNLNSM